MKSGYSFPEWELQNKMAVQNTFSSQRYEIPQFQVVWKADGPEHRSGATLEPT